MKDFGTATLLFFGLSSIFILAWLGAFLTREGRPLAGVVKRHLRAIVVGLVVVHLASDFYDHIVWVDRLDFLVMMLFALMFVPMVKRQEPKC